MNKQFVPRVWQSEAVQAFIDRVFSGEKHGLLFACPGAGKTDGALHIAVELASHFRFDQTISRKILVIVTTSRIKAQWNEEAGKHSRFLLRVTCAGDLLNDIHDSTSFGFVMTYGQLLSMRDAVGQFCEKHRPFVILDEVHHVGDIGLSSRGNTWGLVVDEVCRPACFILTVTGTPFREGNEPISFVNYDEKHNPVPAYKYGFDKAIVDHICRPIEFMTFGGTIEWDSVAHRMTATFKDELARREQSQRLRAALSLDGEYLRTILKAADARLVEVRERGGPVDSLAGGLVVAMDVKHAEGIVSALTEITGEIPTLVHGQLPDADARLKAFDRGASKWIVGVNMLSEGVNVPRLRVGVYASNKKAPLYFHQFCGRFVRWIDKDAIERAFVFIPADPDLEALALTIESYEAKAFDQRPRTEIRRYVAGGMGAKTPIQVIGSEAQPKSIVWSASLLPFTYVERHGNAARGYIAKARTRAGWTLGEGVMALLDAGAIPAPTPADEG